jgi:hypothetical protein
MPVMQLGPSAKKLFFGGGNSFTPDGQQRLAESPGRVGIYNMQPEQPVLIHVWHSVYGFTGPDMNPDDLTKGDWNYQLEPGDAIVVSGVLVTGESQKPANVEIF